MRSIHAWGARGKGARQRTSIATALLAGFEDLRGMIRAQLATQPARGAALLRFARTLIEHAHEHQRLFRALVGKRGGQVVLQRFLELVVVLVKEELPPGASQPAREAAVHFLSGAFLELLKACRNIGPAERGPISRPALRACRRLVFRWLRPSGFA